MKTLLLLSSAFCIALLSSSCMVGSLVTAPIKVAGDVAQGAYNVGKGTVHVLSSDDDKE